MSASACASISKRLGLLAVLACAAASVQAQDSLRISERVGHRLDASERAYFSVLPTLSDGATVWLRRARTGSLELVSDAPGQPPVVMAMSEAERMALAAYLDGFEADGEALLGGAVPLGRFVRYRATVQRDVPRTRLGLRDGTTRAGRLLYARNGRVLFWPSAEPYDWRQADRVERLAASDIAWIDTRTRRPARTVATAAAALAATGGSVAASEDRVQAAVIGGIGIAAVALDALAQGRHAGRVVVQGRLPMLEVAPVRDMEVFWLGLRPPELSALDAPAAASPPVETVRPMRLHVSATTLRLFPEAQNDGTFRAVEGTTGLRERPFRTERAGAATLVDVSFTPSPRWGVGVLGYADQKIVAPDRDAVLQRRGREAYLYGEAYLMPLPDRYDRSKLHVSLAVGAGVGVAAHESRWRSAPVLSRIPAFYSVPVLPENDPLFTERSNQSVTSPAAVGRVSAEGWTSPRTSVYVTGAYHYIPKPLKLPYLHYNYFIANGFHSSLFIVDERSISLSHAVAGLGLRLHF